MKKYGVEYRTLFNEESGTIRNVYSPVVYKKNHTKVFVSYDGEIMEFDKREDAMKQAEGTYNKLKNKNVDWIR